MGTTGLWITAEVSKIRLVFSSIAYDFLGFWCETCDTLKNTF